ncbi:hypothetical protein [Cryobacterium aureum]|uniref:hypothetical protein n=1 Tax=Cryobacterium aureum TaxID=995037 RepID=UPI001374ADC0|nr:hypothetical protein [Cryobacterium aureum]
MLGAAERAGITAQLVDSSNRAWLPAGIVIALVPAAPDFRSVIREQCAAHTVEGV